MSIEIQFGPIKAEGRQLCGACFAFAESISVVPGGPIMVSPKSETAKRTGLGQSEAFGFVYLPFSKVVAFTDGHGVIHLQAPVTRMILGIAGEEELSKIHFASVAHDLKPLP